MTFNYLKLRLLIGISFFISGAVQAGSTDEIQIPYYARVLDAPAYEILCLNTRKAVNPIIFGHSSLTSFRIAKTNNFKKGYAVDSAISTGFWPYKKVSKNDSEHKARYLHYDNPDDYFLTFNKNSENLSADRHCVPITKAEKDDMTAFIAKNKKKRWSVLYNCNDISSKAFEIATGIKFNSRSPVTAYLSHPANLVAEVKKYHKIHQPVGNFTYAPKAASEKKVLAENIKIQEDLDAAEKKAANAPRRSSFRTFRKGNR